MDSVRTDHKLESGQVSERVQLLPHLRTFFAAVGGGAFFAAVGGGAFLAAVGGGAFLAYAYAALKLNSDDSALTIM